MAYTNSRFVLARRPVGLPSPADFRLEIEPAPAPGPGECLVHALYLSVDPYMRGRMRDEPSYVPPLQIGEVITSGVVGRVVESRDSSFAPGDAVMGYLGWQEYAVAPGQALTRVDESLGPLSTALGVLGMPGLTAYFGMLDVGRPKPGETVLVSGAAGAVGSVAGQIAKIQGCRVLGTAGSDEKVRHIVEDLGFDGAFNYKNAGDYGAKLRELAPEGIDIYFDNVGGSLTDAVFPLLKLRARIALCGQIAQYNAVEPETGPRLLWHLIVKRARAEGFLILDYMDRFAEGLQALAGWVRDGKIRYRETVVDGFVNAPEAFIAMLEGGNIGKALVRVSKE